jgi:phenylalanyl-tRNA synthetase alpha subunit
MDNTLERIYSEIDKDLNLPYEELKAKYLGNNGLLTLALKNISTIPNEEKAAYGKNVNALKARIIEILDNKLAQSVIYEQNARIDPTAPFDVNTPKDKRSYILDTKGTKHPLQKK